METYKIKIPAHFLPLLGEVRKLLCNTMGHPFDYQEDKVNELLEISAATPETLLWIGFFLERYRESQQQQHYDLKDQGKVLISVPKGFLLICKSLELNPVGVLEVFVGDLAQHPFNTNGSDERMMAKEYFLRAYSTGEEEDEEIFYELDELRRSWNGNSSMDEFKQRYREELQKIERELDKRKEASNEPK